MNNDIGIQTLFFESIRQRLPGHISLVNELSEVLGISYDSAYRRLRGDKKLSIEEMRMLSRKYRISIDSLFGQSIADVMFHPFVMKGNDGFEDWLKLRASSIVGPDQVLTTTNQLGPIMSSWPYLNDRAMWR